MRQEELKTLWKLAKMYFIVGFIFWVIETIIFLIIEGWHYKATNPIEIYCDKIVVNFWNVAFNITVVTCTYFLINLDKNK